MVYLPHTISMDPRHMSLATAIRMMDEDEDEAIGKEVDEVAAIRKKDTAPKGKKRKVHTLEYNDEEE